MRAHELLALFGSLLIVATAVSAIPFPSGASRGAPLSADELRAVSGLDQKSHVTRLQSCEERYTEIFYPPSAPVVPDSGCTTANSGPGGGTNCVECEPHGNVSHFVLNPGTPPGYDGTKLGPTHDCGDLSMGECAMLNGEPGCRNLTPMDEPCLPVTERWNQ